MSGVENNYAPDSPSFSRETLPRTALQALYHAVTGKTDNLSKILHGNVFICYQDFERLYERLQQQVEHYDLLSSPTVSVVLKQANSKSQTYSSWEKFREFQINAFEITSEVSIKLEFLAKLPSTVTPQRCVVNVSLDSGLPVIHENFKQNASSEFLSFFFPISQNFPTVEISIDFVDFLVAKILAGVIEEWFFTLKKINNSAMTSCLITYTPTIRAIVNQFGRVGMAVFLASYIWFNKGGIGTIGRLSYSISIGLLLWSVFAVVSTSLLRVFSNRLSRNIVPSIMLISEGDKRAYEEVSKRMNSSYKTLGSVIVVGLSTVLLNVLSSYIYSYLNSAP